MVGYQGVHGKNGEKYDAFFYRSGVGEIDRGVQAETGRYILLVTDNQVLNLALERSNKSTSTSLGQFPNFKYP